MDSVLSTLCSTAWVLLNAEGLLSGVVRIFTKEAAALTLWLSAIGKAMKASIMKSPKSDIENNEVLAQTIKIPLLSFSVWLYRSGLAYM